MAKQFFKKYSYDIALDEEVGTNLISWTTGLMVFFVTLTLATNLGLSSLSKNWITDLSGTLTVEIKPPIKSNQSAAVHTQSKKKFKNKINKIMSMLHSRKDIAEARLLSDKEIRDLIEPWIGENTALDAIPLPTLIDIKISENTNTTQLKLDLTKIEPSVSIDNHTDTIDDIQKIIQTSSSFIFILSIIIASLAVISISGIVRSKLLIHKVEIETLHLIGASNEYIAKQFRHHTLHNTLKGALIGVGFTFITLTAIGLVTKTLNTDIFHYISLMPLHWFLLATAPVVIGTTIAHLTAQATALRELSKLT